MRATTILAAILLSSTVWSQERPFQQGPYLGVTMGAFHWDQGGPLVSLSDTAPIVKLYGGFRFNDRWAVEGSYSNRSHLKDQTIGIASDFQIIEVRGLAYLGNLFVGVGYWNADIVETRPFFPSAGFRDNDSDFSGILGGEWSFRNRWDLRLDYELFNVQNRAKDMSTLSFGAHYKFGRH